MFRCIFNSSLIAVIVIALLYSLEIIQCQTLSFNPIIEILPFHYIRSAVVNSITNAYEQYL